MEKVLNMTVDRAGVDEASETAGRWLESTGIGSRDIVRIRLAVEEILMNICEHGQGNIKAEISLYRHFGADTLRIRYGGGRFDPGKPADNEAEEFTQTLLKRTGILPAWRWRFGRNEVTMPVSAP